MRERGEHRGHADATQADDDHGVTRPWASRIDHRAAAGQHGAPEQRRDLWGYVRRNGHDRSTVDDRVGRETGDPEVVMNRMSIAREPAFAGHQCAGRIGRATRHAWCEPVGRARLAGPAPR